MAFASLGKQKSFSELETVAKSREGPERRKRKVERLEKCHTPTLHCWEPLRGQDEKQKLVK